MRYFKVLSSDNRSCNGGNPNLIWSLPVLNAGGTWTAGEWMPEATGKLKLCSNGYHLTDAEHLIQWLNVTIYEAEPSDEVIKGDDKIVCRSVRLLQKMAWNERVARLFACDCAERVLPLFEKRCPDDQRPRRAIETARRYANGRTTQEELAAAGGAAWAAARAAADAARAAAGAAAWDAAWTAARAAAGAAARAAAEDAANAARAAARAAADAARAAAGAAESAWQAKRLMEYLEGGA